MRITENQLDSWVRAHAREAQETIVELVARLTAAAVPRPRDRRFALADSIGQVGPDGVLDVTLGFDPFVPDGKSYWEIGTGGDPRAKANRDYNDLVASVPAAVRADATFVFVTPLSGVHDWPHTWKPDGQATWLQERQARGDWKDVRLVDGTKLVEWLGHFPAVALWLVQKLGHAGVHQLETVEQRWDLIRSFGEPPPLVAELFLANRDEAIAKISEVFADNSKQLKLNTLHPAHVVDFLCAYVAQLDEAKRADAVGRCMIVSGEDGWNAMISEREPHILIADPRLDLTGDAGTRLIQKARRANHAIIFGGPQTGIPDPASVALRSPSIGQIEQALKAAGYGEQRARAVAQKSGGSLSTLLRCVQNLSLLPEWAESSASAELRIAMLIGGWNETVEGDRSAIEGLAGNSYGEWISRLREVSQRPNTPLSWREGRWKLIPRYEAWYALGSGVFNETLERLEPVILTVLGERHPQFELAQEERFAASIHGKVLHHSERVRNGLAETLALLGNHADALGGVSKGKPEQVANSIVRKLLEGADWITWASLNDVLPLLAEAAPGAFLTAIEQTLRGAPSVFDEIYGQEGSGIVGSNWLTGILWALETLAWDERLLGRVVLCLGGLAARDPGGQWANRPSNSLRTIFLPWLPQTCARLEIRLAAIRALQREFPEVAWKLVLALLPELHSSSSYTRQPTWRSTIPEDWTPGVSHLEYSQQVGAYLGIALEAAASDLPKLLALLDRLENIRDDARDLIIARLEALSESSLPEADRTSIWEAVTGLVAKHSRFSEAEWALDQAVVETLSRIALKLQPDDPAKRYARLFSASDFALLDGDDDYEGQHKRLEERRRQAVDEVVRAHGVGGVLRFAESVDSPSQVGVSYAWISSAATDSELLPKLLMLVDGKLYNFIAGYVWGRFQRFGLSWVDSVNTDAWNTDAVAIFFGLLPFTVEVWTRVEQRLEEAADEYWRRAHVQPYQASGPLTLAIERLVNVDRGNDAIACIAKMIRDNQWPPVALTVRALMSAVVSNETPQRQMHVYEVVETIKALQANTDTDPGDLLTVEWAYLPLLDGHHGARPTFLERKLAEDPEFFGEILRLAFRSEAETDRGDLPEGQKAMAMNAYRLLDLWRIPPGTQDGAPFDGQALIRWMSEVRRSASETGRLPAAMSIAGRVLTFAPPDPDGLWIHRSAAELLDQENADGLRNGFRIQIFNSRGVHWVDPSGKPEEALARKYGSDADAVEAAGFMRLASVLRDVAETYEREAHRVRERALSDV